MKISRCITATLALLATLSACRKESAQEIGPGEKTGHPITWRSSVDTKAAAAYNTESLKATSIGVRALWTDQGKPYGSTTSPYLYWENQVVKFNAGDNLWHCDPVQYWLLGKQISFFAYAPWTDDEDVFKFSTTGSSYLQASFAQNDNPALQTDLLLAKPALDQVMSGGPVPLEFKHSLSKVLVYLNIQGDAEGHKFKLKSMSLSGVAGGGTVDYNASAGGFSWMEIPRGNTAVRNKTYNLSIAAGTLEDEYLTHVDDLTTETGLARYLRVQTAPDGDLMMIPQPLTTKAKFTLNLTSYKDDGSGTDTWIVNEEEAPVELILPAENSWEAGNIYCYTITLDITHHYIIQFGITIQEWGTSTQTVTYPE